MPIFEVRDSGLIAVKGTRFEDESLYERRDIQRLLKEQIECLGDRLLVLAEEFSDWKDSSRRIDLLCLDAGANLVVVELKRNEDGGFMELQALRYAAMVSSMTFEQAVEALARHKNKASPDIESARSEILSFLGWEEVDDAAFALETKIILVAADFSKELTTSVLWLLEYGLEIRCIRLAPYRLDDGRLLMDIQQRIPLPEAAEFRTQIGVKKLVERKDRAERHGLRFAFWDSLLERARQLTDLHAGRSPNDGSWISGSSGRAGYNLSYVTRQRDSQVELWIVSDKAGYHQLHAQRSDIEADFGAPLEWQELPDKEGSRVRHVVQGGYRSPPEDWPQIHEDLIDAMIRLDRAFRRRLQALS